MIRKLIYCCYKLGNKTKDKFDKIRVHRLRVDRIFFFDIASEKEGIKFFDNFKKNMIKKNNGKCPYCKKKLKLKLIHCEQSLPEGRANRYSFPVHAGWGNKGGNTHDG